MYVLCMCVYVYMPICEDQRTYSSFPPWGSKNPIQVLRAVQLSGRNFFSKYFLFNRFYYILAPGNGN